MSSRDDKPLGQSRLANMDGVATPKKTNHLTDQQKTRLFACLCVARYIHDASDDDDSFSEDIYEQTLALMEPHWRRLDFEQKPSYITVRKLWKDFIRTGLIGPPKLKTKLGSKGPRIARADDEARDARSSLTKYGILGLFVLCLLTPFVLSLISAEDPRVDQTATNSRLQHELKVKTHIDHIKSEYPGSLTFKQLNTIRARLEMMKREVSVLLLLGRSHDIQCKVDKTFCIGQAIANITQYPQFGYIDARKTLLDSKDLTSELAEVLDERNDVMVIDSLDKFPGTEVMSLFQFVDRDEMNKRRKGLLVLILYTGEDTANISGMRDAEIVERTLVPRWSKYVKGDTLTSVISRISGTVVRVQ